MNGNGSSTPHASGGRLDTITAEQVQLVRSAVRSIEAEQARLEQAAAQRLRAGHATIERSAIGSATIGQATLQQSSVGIVVGRSVACDEARVGILVSPVVRGHVRTWLDIRSALAVGVGIALGRALLAGTRAAIRHRSR
jgi:hypothetical protein